MKTISDGGPAYPVLGHYEQETGYIIIGHSNGMTLRDWFAGRALQGFMSNSMNGPRSLDHLARCCYEVADAMLAEREKGASDENN